jgi:hypothetical protein
MVIRKMVFHYDVIRNEGLHESGHNHCETTVELVHGISKKKLKSQERITLRFDPLIELGLCEQAKQDLGYEYDVMISPDDRYPTLVKSMLITKK